eukprot:CAMPEP_0174820056 /NCGR_PEP_ID=MMETSP1107-20130205/3618_1 /TAXON_ID=36770 /ORGANISM="Paraphysomonas vestita, Strain GFlagA" /LENGTH=684 /DNA_ID=CAMNT_0016034635 /DNA_START=156 /DNA_END=2210 /DNA_ORIENTATION=+
MRMSQVHGQNDSKVRPVTKEISGHPPRNPLAPQVPQRQVPITYQPPIEVKSKTRHDTQHSKSNKNKGRGRNSPVDTSFGSMPHGLTVQELKELTRIRLAREAMNNYSSEASDYSDTRTHTTTATFRSGYSGGDIDSYSDSGSVHRNRSTSTSPTSNTDSDSFDEGYTRYATYHHPPIPISPSSLNRSDRERQIPSYSPENSTYMTPIQYNKSPHTSPSVNSTSPSLPLSLFPNNNSNNNNHNNNITQPKYVAGIHPGLQLQQQQQSKQTNLTGLQQQQQQKHNNNNNNNNNSNIHNLIRPTQQNISDYTFNDIQISLDDVNSIEHQIPIPTAHPPSHHLHHQQQPPQSQLQSQSTLQNSNNPNNTSSTPVILNQSQRSTSLIQNGFNPEREPVLPLSNNSVIIGGISGIPSSGSGLTNSNISSGNSLRKLALTNTMNNLETGPNSESIINHGISTPPLNPLFPYVSPSVTDLSPPGSPQRSFRGKKKLSIDCPAPVRIRSSSDCNELAYEMAEAVLNSPGPNSPMNGSSKPIWSDPPSRRTSTCSVHSDTGRIDGILHDSTGIGLSVPAPVIDHNNNNINNLNNANNIINHTFNSFNNNNINNNNNNNNNGSHQVEEIWKNDHEPLPIKTTFPMSPVSRAGIYGTNVLDTYHFIQFGGDQSNHRFAADGINHNAYHSTTDYQWK